MIPLLFCLPLLAQAPQPAFDAASVKLADPATQTFPAQNTGGPGSTDPGRIHYPFINMLQLLMRAYGVDVDQISGLDDRDKDSNRWYQIDATMPGNASKEQFQLMLQNLLAERFHLQVHRESRNFPGYDLLVAKDGPKLKQAQLAPDEPAEMAKATIKDGKIVFGTGARLVFTPGNHTMRLQFSHSDIDKLVRELKGRIPEALDAEMNAATPHARIVDKTGLTGRYDFALEYACLSCKSMAELFAVRGQSDSSDAPPAPVAADPGISLPTIFVAIEKQLGLRLEKTKDVPLDVIVVDRVDKVPTGN